MLEGCQSAKERWGGVNEIIDRWLHERQEMLVQYCSLSSPDDAYKPNSIAEKVRSLCQIMMDYVSAGHFEVYEQLIREGKDFNDTQALDEADALYHQVKSTTDAVLDFNDKYLETDDLGTFFSDLSEIGVQLETRFEAEDRMIEVLHTAHKDLVA